MIQTDIILVEVSRHGFYSVKVSFLFLRQFKGTSIIICPIIFLNVSSRKLTLNSSFLFRERKEKNSHLQSFLFFSTGRKIGLQTTWSVFKDWHEPVCTHNYYVVNHLLSYH